MTSSYGPPQEPYQQPGYGTPPQAPGQPFPPPPPGYVPAGGYYPPAPPPAQKSRVGLVIGLVVGGVVLLGVIGCLGIFLIGGRAANDAASRTSNDQKSANADVTITGCDVKDSGFDTFSLEASLDVKNNTTKSRAYFIDVAFTSEDGKTQIDTGIAVVSSLEPGQVTHVKATAPFQEQKPTELLCKVTEVTRI